MEALPEEPESGKTLPGSQEDNSTPQRRQSLNDIAFLYTIYLLFFFASVYMVIDPQAVLGGARSPVKEALGTIGGLIGMLLLTAFPGGILVNTSTILKDAKKKLPLIAGMLFNFLLVATTLVFVFLSVERLGVSNSSVSALITLGAGAFLLFASFKFLDFMDWLRKEGDEFDKKKASQPQPKKEPTKSNKAIRAALPIVEAYFVAMMGVLSLTVAIDPSRLDFDLSPSWLPWVQVAGLAGLTVVTASSITLFKNVVTRLKESSVSTTVGIIALIIHAVIIAGTVAGTSFGELWIDQQAGSTATKFIPLFSLVLAVAFNYLRKNQKEVDEHNKQIPQSS